jgi:hypothetical protein
MKFIQICLTALVFSSFSISAVADPNASTYRSYPIYSCDSQVSSCKNEVQRKASVVVNLGGNPYSYAYAVDVRTNQLTKYRVNLMFERRDKIVTVMKTYLDQASKNEWAHYKMAYDNYNQAVSQFIESENQSLNYAMNFSEKKLPLSFLFSPAYATGSCENAVESDGTLANANAAEFASSSSIRSAYYASLNGLDQFALDLSSAWNSIAAAGNLSIPVGGGELTVGLASLRYTGATKYFKDGSHLKVEANPVTDSVSVVEGSIVDCNGNEYGNSGEFGVGQSWTFNTDSSFNDFHNFHGSNQRAGETTTSYYFYCWTSSPGTVTCKKMPVTIRF